MIQIRHTATFLIRGGFLLAAMGLCFSGLKGQVTPPGRDTVTLFVLDFDNLQGDARLDWLSKALKDMILLRMEEELRIKGRDAGDISPFLQDRAEERVAEDRRHLASNTILLMGSYRRVDARLVVELQLMDMKDWSSLDRGTVEALYTDIPLLNQLLAEKVHSMVKGIEFFSGIDIDAPLKAAPVQVPVPKPKEPAYAPPDRYGAQMSQRQEDLARAVEDLEEAMDVYSGYRQPPAATQQTGESYYRDFSLEGQGALPEEKARYTEVFEDILKRVAQNPYSADIGDLSLEVDPYNDDRVYMSIPVAYRVKKALVEDMLYSLPYVSTREERHLRTIRYDKSKFSFSKGLVDRIARGDYRVIPVVQVLDPAGKIRAVLVDSPDMSWERYFPRQGMRVVRQKRFYPLLAVTTSGFSIDVRMETGDMDMFYEFDIDASQLSSYARVVVRFMKEDELYKFLRSL